MENHPEHEICFNLFLCYYAMGDVNRMKTCFNTLACIEFTYAEEDTDFDSDSKDMTSKEDPLFSYLKVKRIKAINTIVRAGRMIAPLINTENVYIGYDYVIEIVKTQNIAQAEGELEMCKALVYLKDKDFENAIIVLKGFELKDKSLRSRAATNISFI